VRDVSWLLGYTDTTGMNECMLLARSSELAAEQARISLFGSRSHPPGRHRVHLRTKPEPDRVPDTRHVLVPLLSALLPVPDAATIR